MKKLLYTIIISTTLLGGCNALKDITTENNVPRTMPVNEYKGQGFQPKAEKDAIELAKKHKKEFADLGERFFKDNFGLNVKATNVVGNEDGIEVFVHCDDHDIVFNSSILLTKNSLGHKGNMRASEESDELATQIGKVVSGFDYKANKKEYDELYQYFKDNQKKYGYYGYTKEAINKTQNSGYQNEFFWINGSPTTLENYDKYYKPLIKQKNNKFKQSYLKNRKIAINQEKSELITSLFSKSTQYNPKKESYKLPIIAKDINQLSIGPSEKEVSIFLFYTENKLETFNARPYQNHKAVYEVYPNEKHDY